MAAIRECFEESGILLAKSLENPEELLMLSDEERQLGRHAIHQETISFQAWVKQRNGTPDVGMTFQISPWTCVQFISMGCIDLPVLDNLIPFTRWLTPARLSKRFTTQMYLYFLPLPSRESLSSSPLSPSFMQSPSSHFPSYQIPTSDGGIEHTTANFLPPSEWLSQYARKEIILFFPQFYLLSLITPFFSPLSPPSNTIDIPALIRQREALIEFTNTSDPPWGQKCLSSVTIFEDEEKYVNSLDHPGPELDGTLRKGDSERLMIIYKDQGERKAGAPRFGLVLRKDFAVEKEKEKL